MGLKLKHCVGSMLSKCLLKSDQNGIEMGIPEEDKRIEFAELKSDQNGIEMLVHGR